MEHDHPFDLLANEAILPAQFYSARRNLEPEKRLALAVLETAIRDYRGAKSVRARQEPSDWLFVPANGPFSMDGVCDLLGIEASVLRKALRDWDGQLGKRSPVWAGRQRPMANRGRRRISTVR